MAAEYRLEIFTPYRLFFRADVEAIVVKLADGEVGIYAGHSRFTAPVRTCALRIKPIPTKEFSGEWKPAFVTNGIIEVKRHKVVLLCDAAEWPEEIDMERALASKKSAESTLANSAFKFEHIAAKEKLIRAQTRLSIVDYKEQI
ncbi:MAG: ATP synthase F1 subunit epsilon [Spirochaetaceae bacterium]|jgi:F-type H+-transporting ATPase subunit epsilon|nr:ATP synthase F1 subunit epsilon [Spirochaetaceae bacterium]GMO28467.1 MAG: F0F1 ATP synthase subunit epsilon [Termitinemataceae bacterium]